MTWIITATGASVDVTAIAPASVSLLDIAHSLSRLQRWNGHTAQPYTVAEHSLLVADIMERRHGVRSPVTLLAGLMHDAHEYLTGDLSTPMKQLIGPAWTREETRIQCAVLERFGLLEEFRRHHHIIKSADLAALATEWRDFFPHCRQPMHERAEPATWVDLTDRAGFTWADWRQAFLDRFAELQEHATVMHGAPTFAQWVAA